ncbi:MAG: hypothetical protein KJ709_04765 [Nanoarchaeota archaeon]|nr:hypothetical protein [Nanoarchaeota archaeon]
MEMRVGLLALERAVDNVYGLFSPRYSNISENTPKRYKWGMRILGAAAFISAVSLLSDIEHRSSLARQVEPYILQADGDPSDMSFFDAVDFLQRAKLPLTLISGDYRLRDLPAESLEKALKSY